MASARATYPPVIAAVRVPPSAWMTSQSTVIVRSPSWVELHHRAQGAPDEPLDLVRPAAGPARLAARPGRRRAGQHAVLRRDPALAAAAQERGHAVLDRRGADHAGVADLDQDGALGVARVAAREPHRAEVPGRPAVVARHRFATAPTRWS